MSQFLDYSQLSNTQIEEYQSISRAAFPDIIYMSEVVKNCWGKVEEYFPELQLYLMDDEGKILGFMNMLPLRWTQPLPELPDDGWDWLVKEGFKCYEEGTETNTIGGLQVIIAKEHLGKGYSKLILDEAKLRKERLGISNFIIPIRPTLKSEFPTMEMEAYINYKKEGKIYDPWIRTHLRNGAKLIRTCHNAMYIKGSIAEWESLVNRPIHNSGYHIVPGALSPVQMNIEKDLGEYREPNIWISYM